MIAQWDSSLSVLPVARVQFPAMAEYFQGIFLWLITCASLYTVQGKPKRKKAFSLMKIMRCLRINLAYGRQKKQITGVVLEANKYARSLYSDGERV